MASSMVAMGSSSRCCKPDRSGLMRDLAAEMASKSLSSGSLSLECCGGGSNDENDMVSWGVSLYSLCSDRLMH